MAFPYDIKKIIKKRYHGRCAYHSQNCRGYLDCAHRNHSKKSSEYFNPDNGVLLCLQHHLEQHQRMEGRNGLTKKQNKWAIKKIIGRLEDYLDRH